MRHDYSIWRPAFAAVVLFINIQPVLAAAPKHEKEKAETSPAITALQLEIALVPITDEIRHLRAEDARLGQLIATAERPETTTSILERDLMTIRIALVAMGLGTIGGLVKLRSIARKISN